MAIVKISDLPLVDSPVEGTDLFVVVQDNVTKKAYASDIQTYVGFEEIQTATAGQTVFNLTTMTYAAGANNLMVFVDGVNQYEGSSYVETDNNTVTFTQGLHVGALVKFSTVQTQTSLVNSAGAVTFTAAGAGAVPRSVQSKERDIVSVKDFGAQGDGVTDDTAAIQAAVATGANVYFPKGIYNVSSTISVTAANQCLFGEGNECVIQQVGVNFSVITLVANATEIKNLRFNGAATSADAANVYFAVFTDETFAPDNVKIYNCLFSGASAGSGFRGAVKINAGCNFCVVENCQFERLWGSSTDCGYGVICGNVTGFRAINNKGVATSGRGRHLIYFSAGASDCLAAFNYAEGFGEAGIQQFSQAAQPPCYRNTFAYNNLFGCSTNATSTSSALQISGRSVDAKIIGNQVANSGRNGIAVYNFLLNDCSSTTIADNSVINSAYSGIYLTGLTGTNILRGNIVRESSQVSAGAHSNIQIDSDDVTPVATTNVLVQGNHSTGTLFARSPIAIAGATPPTGISLDGNYFPVCNVSGISINAGITVTGTNVTGTWTPALKFGGNSTALTTSTARGTWVRTGNLVTATCYIVLTNKGSSTGVAEIYGLPFNSVNQDSAVTLHLVDVSFTDQPQAYIATNLLQLQNIDNSGTRTNLTNSNFANTSQIRATVTYFV